MTGKEAESTAVARREAASCVRKEGIYLCSMSGASVRRAVWCRDLGRESSCCVACACYSWGSAALSALQQEGWRSTAGSKISCESGGLVGPSAKKLSLLMTHWKNTGSMLSAT